MYIKTDPYLEEVYLRNKYSDDIDIELARMYEKANTEQALKGDK